jgi:hypothetical protein
MKVTLHKDVNHLLVEEGKAYRIWLEGWEDDCAYLVPLGDYTLYPRCRNIRYTHYFNSLLLGNANQMSLDYINDCLRFNQEVAVSLNFPNNKIGYYKIKNIEPIDNY